MLENKEKQEDENTIKYYRPNRVLTNVMIVVEVVYCLICMVLFLLVIYWNTKSSGWEVILGKDEAYNSEEEDKDTNNYVEKFQELNYDLQRRAYNQKYMLNTDRAHLNNSLVNINLLSARNN